MVKILTIKNPEAKMLTSTISSKGQVTIPKEIREFLKLKTFDKIAFIPIEEGKVVITSKEISVSALFGMLKDRKRKEPVSLQEMEVGIRRKRTERGTN